MELGVNGIAFCFLHDGAAQAGCKRCRCRPYRGGDGFSLTYISDTNANCNFCDASTKATAVRRSGKVALGHVHQDCHVRRIHVLNLIEKRLQRKVCLMIGKLYRKVYDDWWAQRLRYVPNWKSERSTHRSNDLV